MHLLTVKEVALLLNLSVGTIYEHRFRLGGFYPAGIRVLRFKEDIIHGYMAGPDIREVQVQVSVPESGLRRRRIQDQEGRGNRLREKAEINRFSETAPRHGFVNGRITLLRSCGA